MRLARRRKRRRKLIITSIILIILVFIVVGLFTFLHGINATEEHQEEKQFSSQDEKTSVESEEKKGGESIKIQLAAAGDIMFHDSQLESAYDEQTDTYDFTPFFEDVKPILSSADLTIANFETTTAGPEKEYTGYPQFNSPDEVIDAIKDAGVDVLTTVNNHSLDTGSEGLKRTVQTIQERGIDTVGTYAKNPDSRVLIKEVEGIKFAIIAYTESTNGLGANYPKEELDAMLNLMEKDKIIADIKEAKIGRA